MIDISPRRRWPRRHAALRRSLSLPRYRSARCCALLPPLLITSTAMPPCALAPIPVAATVFAITASRADYISAVSLPVAMPPTIKCASAITDIGYRPGALAENLPDELASRFSHYLLLGTWGHVSQCRDKPGLSPPRLFSLPSLLDREAGLSSFSILHICHSEYFTRCRRQQRARFAISGFGRYRPPRRFRDSRASPPTLTPPADGFNYTSPVAGCHRLKIRPRRGCLVATSSSISRSPLTPFPHRRTADALPKTGVIAFSMPSAAQRLPRPTRRPRCTSTRPFLLAHRSSSPRARTRLQLAEMAAPSPAYELPLMSQRQLPPSCAAQTIFI